MTDPRIKLLDLDEHTLVLAMLKTGDVEVHTAPGFCDAAAAAVLHSLAEQLATEHGPAPCTPGSEQQHVVDDLGEPLAGRDSTLDTDRSVWTDGRGHAWDLSLGWLDGYGRTWQWTGLLDYLGVPMMSAEGADERETLDVIRTYGISPVAGDQ